MENQRMVVLFPGQGAYYGGVLSAAAGVYPHMKDVFAEIDAVAGAMLHTSVSQTVFGPNPPGIADLLAHAPEVLQLAIYGVSVATHRMLASHGLRPAILVGHSFGEIAALVCAGAFSVGEGAEIVYHRMASLQQFADGGGYMAAVGTDAHRAEKMVELVGNHRVAVAGENHAAQTVVSGAGEMMDAVGELARVLQIPFTKLDSPCPFHSPLMAPAAAEFCSRLRRFTQQPLRTPVFSPILGRYYTDADDLATCLADHLVRPVQFAGTIRRLHGEGTRVFVECGALDALVKIVRKVVDDPTVVTVACLDPRLGETAALELALHTLRGHGLLGSGQESLAELLLPGVDAATCDAFWAAHGAGIVAHARDTFAAFSQARVAPEAAVAPPVSAAPAPADPSNPTDSPAAGAPEREMLYRELAALYAEALEYPEEVFGPQVELEAELGVDSVKQTELLARVGERYNLPPRPADFRLSDYPTLGTITDFVLVALDHTASGVAERAAVAAGR